MFALLAVLFIVVPLVELYVIIQVGSAIGALNTIGLMIIISLVGAWLAKHEGAGVITRVREQSARGEVPTNHLIDGALIFAGGLMLLVPGFISDFLGILLLFPPTRAVFRVFIKRRFTFISFRQMGGPPRYDGPDDVIDI